MKVVASTRAAALGPPSGAAMADVNRELVEVITDEWWRRVDRARLTRLIALTDAMLEELELLNLADVARVSAEWQERLVVLLASLPFEYRPRLRAFPSPTEVLDVIFDIQGQLFALRNDGRPMERQLTGEDAVRHTYAKPLEGEPCGYAVSIQGSRAQLRPGGFAGGSASACRLAQARAV